MASAIIAEDIHLPYDNAGDGSSQKGIG